MISKIFSLRNWVMKQLMKTDKSGIMKIPPKGKLDFGEMLLKEKLFKKGIDPGMITSEKQLDNIINTPTVQKSERVMPQKSGEVIQFPEDKITDWTKPRPTKKASGGIAGMLGEPTYQDDSHRVPLNEGMIVPPKKPYNAETFKEKSDLYLQAILGTSDKDFYRSKLQNEYEKARKEGALSAKEATEWVRERAKLYSTLINESRRQERTLGQEIRGVPGFSLPTPYGVEPDINKYYEDKKAVGGRAGFKDGKVPKMSRRGFMKLAAGLASIPVFGKYFKWAKPLAKSSKVLTQVPIGSAEGMPLWFKPLVNKVIKEGDDVSTKFATQERQIVHRTQLPDSQTDVIVTQDLNTGDVAVDIGMGKHGFADGHLGQPVRLEYKASEWIEPPIVKEGKVAGHGKGTKTKEEFWVEEAEFTGGHPENVKFEESTFEKFGDHGSNFAEVEKFATGKVTKAGTKRNIGKPDPGSLMKDLPDDFASGGRVPLDGGGITSRVPYWTGGTWKMIKEAIKHNKMFGLGGPPYKPGATSFDIKQLTKDRFGSELSLQELKEMATKKEGFSKFLGGFKEYKAEVIKAQLLESKQKAEIGIKVAKDMLKDMPKGLDPAIANKIYKQTIKQDTKRLKDIEEALGEIDVYKAMKEKAGITSHAEGGRVPLAGGVAGMLGE
jgi:hypothetical protein